MRNYEPTMWVATNVSTPDIQQGTSNLFRKLFAYISGQNTAGKYDVIKIRQFQINQIYFITIAAQTGMHGIILLIISRLYYRKRQL